MFTQLLILAATAAAASDCHIQGVRFAQEAMRQLSAASVDDCVEKCYNARLEGCTHVTFAGGQCDLQHGEGSRLQDANATAVSLHCVHPDTVPDADVNITSNGHACHCSSGNCECPAIDVKVRHVDGHLKINMVS